MSDTPKASDLRDDDALFRAVFDGSPDAIVLSDAHTGLITDANTAACALLQLPLSEIVGMHHAQIYPPEADDLVRERAEEQQSEPIAVDTPLETTVLRADGSQLPVEMTLQLISARGRRMLLSIVRDVTARKRAEGALRRSEERMRRLVEHLPAGAVLRDGELVFLNGAAEKVLGYSRTEITTVDEWFETLHAGSVDDDRQRYEEFRQRGFPDAISMRILRGDGERRELEVAAYRYEHGEVWLLNDVTDQTRALEALRRSEARFTVAVRGSSDGLWDWPDVERREVWFSPRFWELLGFSSDELDATVDIFYEELLHPEDRPVVAGRVQAHFEQHEPFDVEYRLRHKSGHYRWYRARGQAVWDENGNPLRMAGSVQDIDDRKRVEAEREALIQRLQEALAQVKQLSGLLPICANCKKIRNDEGYWARIEDYIRAHSQAEFSHGICPDCMVALYPEVGALQPEPDKR